AAACEDDRALDPYRAGSSGRRGARGRHCPDRVRLALAAELVQSRSLPVADATPDRAGDGSARKGAGRDAVAIASRYGLPGAPAGPYRVRIVSPCLTTSDSTYRSR